MKKKQRKSERNYERLKERRKVTKNEGNKE